MNTFEPLTTYTLEDMDKAAEEFGKYANTDEILSQASLQVWNLWKEAVSSPYAVKDSIREIISDFDGKADELREISYILSQADYAELAEKITKEDADFFYTLERKASDFSEKVEDFVYNLKNLIDLIDETVELFDKLPEF